MSDEPIPCCFLLAGGARCLLPVHHDPDHDADREPRQPPASDQTAERRPS